MRKTIQYVSYFLLFFPSLVFAAGAGITYNGRLLDPSGNAVVSSNVQFRIQIRTPGNENCLMYEEIQSKDMTNSDGVFSITINDGSGSRTDSTGLALDQIFANRGSFSFSAGYCAVGTTYNTSPADGRKLQVYFNDGSFATGQWEPTPAMAINFIPMSIESQQVGGYKKEQILKIADGVPTTGTELDATKWTSLQALINGTSTVYTKPTDQVTQLYGATIPTPANGQSIRWNTALNAGAGGWENFTAGSASAVTTVSSANADISVANGSTTPTLTLNSGTAANQIVKLDGTAKLPGVDGSALTNVNAAKVGGTAVILASLTNGEVLKYNGTNWVNAADSDALGGLSCASGRVAYYSGSSWACLEVTSVNTVNTIVSRDASGISNFGTVNTGTLKVNDGSTGAISLITPVAVTSYTMRLPTSVGSAGQVLTTDGNSPAQLSWSSASSQWTTTGSDIYYNTGKVGIGTSTLGATDKLTVYDGSGADTIVKVKSTGNNSFLRLDGYTGYDWEVATSGNNFTLREYGNQSQTYFVAEGGLPNGSATPIYIKSNGNVGIGSSAPAKQFEVYGSSSSPYASGTTPNNPAVMRVTNADLTNGSYSALAFGAVDAGATWTTNAAISSVVNSHATNAVSADLAFQTKNAGTFAENMRITSAGNVGIGTSNPSDPLSIIFNANSNAGIFVQNSNAGGNSITQLQLKNDSGNSAGLQLGSSSFTNVNAQNRGLFFSTKGLTFLTNNSISSGGTDTIAFMTGGYSNTSTMTITAGNPGKVGIGTTGPSAVLEVVGPSGTSGAPNAASVLTVTGGSGYASGNGNGGGVSITAGTSSGTGTGGNVTISAGAGSGSPSFGPRGSVTINGGDNGSDVNGSVTVRGGYYGGTGTAPQLVLQGSGSTATGNITLSTPNGTGVAGTSGSISISTGNSSMGFSAGAISLTAGNGSNAAAGGAVNITAGNGGATNINGSNVVINPGAGGGTGSYGNVAIASAGGKVGVGTATPSASLEVVGTGGIKYSRSGAGSYISMSDYGGSQPGIYLSGADSSVSTFMHSRGPFKLYSGGSDQGSASAKILLYGDNSGQVGVGTTAPDQLFSVNGDASKVGGGSWQTFSDARLKTVNGEFTRGLEDVLKLQPISYHYNDRNPAGIPNNGDHIGFVAQDVEKVIPEAISKSKKGYLMVNNDPIIWTMFNAIKDLYYKIVAQDATVGDMQKENEDASGCIRTCISSL